MVDRSNLPLAHKSTIQGYNKISHLAVYQEARYLCTVAAACGNKKNFKDWVEICETQFFEDIKRREVNSLQHQKACRKPRKFRNR